MQKVALVQETEYSAPPLRAVAFVQALPFQLSALPAPSTAMQDVVVGQETELSELAASIFTGPDQADPFQLSALPP